MNEAELDALVEAKLAERLEARLSAERARVREETILAIRRDAERAHHAKINAKHVIETPLAGLTPEQDRERLRLMDERSRLAREHLDRVNSRPVPGARSSLRTTAADGAGGGSSFRIKG
jgi:hypothetical protein